MAQLDALIVWGMPALYLAAAGMIGVPGGAARRYGCAEVGAVAAMAMSLVAVGIALATPGRADTLGLTMAVLVGFLGWVVTRFSRRYLHGEPRQRRFFVALLLTLACVSIVVTTDHLLVLVLAWSATSLGLHHLLTYYPERPAALVAAHKKFIASRLAEACIAVALTLIWRETGGFSMTGLAVHVEALDRVPLSLQTAAFLIAVAAILKTAQLPVHGWLIQVMEAPTPVSALLHAGVVNLGGVVLIRLADLMVAALAAQTLLIVVGSLTAVLAGLVAMTRISIKVRLAWSTCAQMGFMLMECGLGLYELALLHLVAHSLYKAHGFLAAGDRVLEARRAAMPPASAAAADLPRLSLPIAMLLVFAAVAVWQSVFPTLDVPFAATLVLGLGLAPLCTMGSGQEPKGRIGAIFGSLAIVHLYLVGHAFFGAIIDTPRALPSPLQTMWVALCFLTLYGVQTWVMAHPAGRLSRALYPWAYAGFHLDERFTRLTLRLWPMRLPATYRTAQGERS